RCSSPQGWNCTFVAFNRFLAAGFDRRTFPKNPNAKQSTWQFRLLRGKRKAAAIGIGSRNSARNSTINCTG
ncbi:MAG: hypothetical protein RSA58_13415, partial [Glutamicibacter sp.]|uniref:hypothetical protein n=1 Tax=Glutamicibacter sp. TaxID=1931995 RepID=UPI002FCA7739